MLTQEGVVQQSQSSVIPVHAFADKAYFDLAMNRGLDFVQSILFVLSTIHGMWTAWIWRSRISQDLSAVDRLSP